jgi:hypothetical protein
MPEVGVLAHPVAVAADVDDMTVVHQMVNERRSHDLIAQDVAPFLEALVGGTSPQADHQRRPQQDPSCGDASPRASLEIVGAVI